MDTNLKNEVKATIEQFFISMDTQDIQLMKQIIAHDNQMVHIGTGENEIWRGWDELHSATKEQFKELEYYKAEIKDLQISLSDSNQVAWYSHLLDARIKSNQSVTQWEDARFTGVLKKQNGEWKIIQTHVSEPDS